MPWFVNVAEQFAYSYGINEDKLMADEQKKAVPNPEPSNANYAVPRREQRHPVSAVYQRYIDLKVQIGNIFVPVILHDFSGSGVLFESQVPLEIESCADCVISISRSLSKEIAFDVRVKHCRKKEDTFLVGAAIETAADTTWFEIFKEAHDFIMQRQGSVY
jgi:hypothetical protein